MFGIFKQIKYNSAEFRLKMLIDTRDVQIAALEAENEALRRRVEVIISQRGCLADEVDALCADLDLYCTYV